MRASPSFPGLSVTFRCGNASERGRGAADEGAGRPGEVGLVGEARGGRHRLPGRCQLMGAVAAAEAWTSPRWRI
jgi:hypothetical protein